MKILSIRIGNLLMYLSVFFVSYSWSEQARDTQHTLNQDALDYYMEAVADGHWAQAHDLENLLFNPDSEEFEKQFQSLESENPEKKEAFVKQMLQNREGWTPAHDLVMTEVMELHNKAHSRADELRSQEGEKYFLDKVEADEAHIVPTNDGYAKWTMIGGHPIVVVTHRATGIAFNYLPSHLMNPEHPDHEKFIKHLERFTARQLLSSIRYEDKNKQGRHVVFVNIDYQNLNSAAVEVEGRPKHKAWQKDYWKDYWKAVYDPKEPNRDTIALGAMCGVAQATAVACVFGAANVLGVGDFTAAQFAKSAVTTMGFAVGIGSMASTYLNWRGLGTNRVLQTMKELSMSLGFAYMITMITRGEATSMSLYDPSGAFLHATIILNSVLNNIGKNAWNQQIKLREEMGYYQGNYELPLGKGKSYKTKFTKRTLEGQMRYIKYPFSIRLPALAIDTVEAKLFGNLAVLASVVWANYLTAREASRLEKEKGAYNPHAQRIARRYRKPWEQNKAMVQKWIDRVLVEPAKSCQRWFMNFR